MDSRMYAKRSSAIGFDFLAEPFSFLSFLLDRLLL